MNTKIYITPVMQTMHVDDSVICASGAATVHGTIGTPTSDSNDVGAPGRRNIWK